MFRELLVAIDFSPCSLRAAEHARTLTRALGGHITLLHVLEVAGDAPQAQAQARLDELAQLGRRPATCLVRLAGPQGVVGTILAVAEEVRSDLLILGAHGQPEFSAPKLGQVTCGVLLQARLPVQIVPQSREVARSLRQRWHELGRL